MTTSRSRTGARSSAPRTRTASKEKSTPIRSSYGAKDGMRQMQEEQRRSEARRESNKQRMNEPRRFYMKAGETREVIIVDDEMQFMRYEHALKNPQTGRFDLFTPCINENANCPVCKVADKPAYFAAYLTVIDLTPYENKDGDTIEWSKRLLVIKPMQQKKYMRLQEREKSLRGLIVELTRDSDTDAAIGNEVEVIERMEEDDLLEYETDYVDKDGKTHDIIGHEPFDYEEAFPEWSEKQLSTVAGGKPSLGNRDDAERSTRSSRRKRDDEEDEAEEEEEEQRPRRAGRDSSRAGRDSSRSGSAGKPATRRRARDEEPEEEEELEEEEEQEEEERPRRGSRSAAKPAARSTSRRAAREEPEEEEEEPEEEEEAEEEEERPRRGSRTASRGSKREYSVEETLPDDDGPQRPARGGRSGGGANRRDALRRR